MDNQDLKQTINLDCFYDVWLMENKEVVGPTAIFGDSVLLKPENRTQTAVCLEDGSELLSIGNFQYS